MKPRTIAICLLPCLSGPFAAAQDATSAAYAAVEVEAEVSLVRPLLERFNRDRGLLGRRYRVSMSEAHAARMQSFYELWSRSLASIDFDGLAQAGKVDYLLFRNLLRHGLQDLEHERARDLEVRPFLPFWKEIVALSEARAAMQPVDAARTADLLDELTERTEDYSATLSDSDEEIAWHIAQRAAQRSASLRSVLNDWFKFYEGYDPEFTWWLRKPHEALSAALEEHEQALEDLLGDDDEAFFGDPIGREALLAQLELAMIPYTPEELLAIAENEFAWCDREMLRAAADLGFGDDRARALEHVKNSHVAPGEQPQLIAELAFEAVEFLEQRDLVTIPELCKETWRMQMMSPARQKYSPYFLGGESIIVSFPTQAMEHRDKLMSMRGNNRHFARATVHHELIPGHHLQGYMNARHRSYRSPFRTPFWGEGWALYWELLLWDLDFQESPEDRIGMLFWRSHRCARILFSLRYHLGEISEQEAIDFLVERVGHERNNATAEVRRSFTGGYGPLYQCAYMLGGLQLRALSKELVDSGRMTRRAFHDAVLRTNSIPIEMVRASLTDEELTPDFESRWRFYD
jgi:uncharacterized protein (DUF885 family)